MGVGLIVTRNGSALDITHLTETVKWIGRKGASGRSINVTILDHDGYNQGRSGIVVEEGNQCIFTYKGKELFRGLITNTTQGQSKKMQFIAHDNGIYLANNEDTFCYTDKTASAIFSDVCARFGIPTGEVASTSYVIPELTKPTAKAYDTVADALSLEYQATGIRHFIKSDKGKLSLIVRKQNILQWVIETGQNITTYSFSGGIDKIKTRVKLLSDQGTSLGQANDGGLESKIGVFQAVKKMDETLTNAQIKEIAESTLAELSQPTKALDIDCLGNAEVISGIGVLIIIPHLGINQTYYVDEDSHTFQDQKHTMRLKLNKAIDI